MLSLITASICHLDKAGIKTPIENMGSSGRARVGGGTAGEGAAGSVRLRIVIVNYNSADPLRHCVNSIMDNKGGVSVEVVVIDNNSYDKELLKGLRGLPNTRLIQNDENVGFSRAANVGLRLGHWQYALVMNPDVFVLPGALETMVQFMEANPGAGLIGAALLNPDGSLQYSCRTFYNVQTLLYRRTALRRLLPDSIERRHLLKDWDHESVREVDWVLGACMMVRRDAVEGVGLLDERFFLYFEDVDWCKRMKDRQWKVCYVPTARMIHQHLRSSARRGAHAAKVEHVKSMVKYFIKHKVMTGWSLAIQPERRGGSQHGAGA